MQAPRTISASHAVEECLCWKRFDVWNARPLVDAKVFLPYSITCVVHDKSSSCWLPQFSGTLLIMTVNDIRVKNIQRKLTAQKIRKKKSGITVKEIEDAVLRAQTVVTYHSFNQPNEEVVENNNGLLDCSDLAYSEYQQVKACVLIQRNFRGFLTRWRVWNFAEGL